MRKIRFDNLGSAFAAVKDLADGLGCNLTITLEGDGEYMFFVHGEKVATWICGDKKTTFHSTASKENPIQRLGIW